MKNLFLLTFTVAFLGVSAPKAWAQQANEYPNMSLMMTNGSIKNAKELPGSSVLIIYFPDCDHCQREATEISKHLKSFEKHPVWFISTASFDDIDNFSRKYSLSGYANIHFVRTDIKDVINNFGGIPTPSVFIYSKDKKLVKAIKGETKIEEIIKYL